MLKFIFLAVISCLVLLEEINAFPSSAYNPDHIKTPGSRKKRSPFEEMISMAKIGADEAKNTFMRAIPGVGGSKGGERTVYVSEEIESDSSEDEPHREKRETSVNSIPPIQEKSNRYPPIVSTDNQHFEDGHVLVNPGYYYDEFTVDGVNNDLDYNEKNQDDFMNSDARRKKRSPAPIPCKGKKSDDTPSDGESEQYRSAKKNRGKRQIEIPPEYYEHKFNPRNPENDVNWEKLFEMTVKVTQKMVQIIKEMEQEKN